MQPAPPSPKVVRFGLFEADLVAGELRKRGRKVELQDQPFHVLALLLGRPKEVVTREELRQALWPADTFVEFDESLNKAVQKLRQALGDSADNPHFIETLPRKGYRFIASVEVPMVPSPTPPARRGRPVWVLGAVAFVAIVAACAAWFWSRLANAPDTAPPVPVPLTSYPGSEGEASFSPDGNQVAFVWDGPKGDNSDIYVKMIGRDEPVRLTKDPAYECCPAWSPDGRWIAFLRTLSAERSGVFLIPAIGGVERKLGEVYWVAEYFISPYLSWHPSGKWVVAVDKNSPAEPHALFLLSIETGEKRKLTSPPSDYYGDEAPAVSPDGYGVVFSRRRPDGICDLYLLELSDDLSPTREPKRVTFENTYKGTPAWLPDGRSIAFSSGSIHTPSLWRMLIRGPGGRPGKPERLVFVGEGAWQPVVSRQGRLVYTHFVHDVDILRLELSSGHRADKPAVKLIPSTRLQHTPQYSPDGKRIAFGSIRSGNWEIWVCDGNGSNAVQLTSFGGRKTGSPYWSPDGQWISFEAVSEGRASVCVIPSDGGKPRGLANEQADSWSPTWSRDGKWIYFTSSRTKEFQVWKMPWPPWEHGGEALQITRKGGRHPALESLDGRFLYYLKENKEVTSLWKVPVNGGAEAQVLEAVYANNFVVVDQGIYFIRSPAFLAGKAGERPSVQFLDFTTGKVVMVAALPKLPAYGLSLSPDGRWLLYAEHEESGSDLMLVENFR